MAIPTHTSRLRTIAHHYRVLSQATYNRAFERSDEGAGDSGRRCSARRSDSPAVGRRRIASDEEER